MENVIWENKPYIYGSYKNDEFKLKSKIAGFDLDGTIILTKSGKKFAKDANDWKFFSNSVGKEMKYYYDNDYSLVIVTNQAGLNTEEKLNEWKMKVNNIIKQINLPIKILGSVHHDIYRKPIPTLFNEFIKQSTNQINLKDCLYVGDACGRPTDHGDCDYKFALNCKIKFFTPEEVFLKETVLIPNIIYHVLDEIKQYSNNKKFNFEPNKFDKEIVLTVGMQGSGKSTFATNFLVPEGYIRINQDTLKTKVKCLKETEENMKLDKNIVVDNTNAKKDSRAEFIKLANKYNYKCRCVIMDVSDDYAKHNANYRSYKTVSEFMPSIAFNMYKKNYEEPTIQEGFVDIVKLKPVIDKYTDDYLMYF